jgi:demethylmenaquinone methyltransferase/2-methoxy-6-polyprenyl-1,4-benzoquinol methylase
VDDALMGRLRFCDSFRREVDPKNKNRMTIFPRGDTLRPMDKRLPAAPPVIAPHAPLRRYYPDERDRKSFVREIFDNSAADYDRVERTMALGSGSWYRRQALRRAGLKPGMKVLDVAMGTGLVAREAMALAGNSQLVFGVEPSAGMLAQAVRQLSIRAVRGTGEQLPLAADTFDFLSMGYALRHLSDLRAAFGEFYRVLKPGGTVCIIEISRPAGKISAAALRWYMKNMVPMLSRLAGNSSQSPRLWQYYADTIEACIPPELVLDAMRDAGFVEVNRYVEWSVFSEYTGRKGEHTFGSTSQ